MNTQFDDWVGGVEGVLHLPTAGITVELNSCAVCQSQTVFRFFKGIGVFLMSLQHIYLTACFRIFRVRHVIICIYFNAVLESGVA